MEYKVIYKGDIDYMNKPYILNDDEFLIPKKWYLLNNEIENNIKFLFNNKHGVIEIFEKIDINHSLNNEEFKFSIVKIDKKLNVNDILTIN